MAEAASNHAEEKSRFWRPHFPFRPENFRFFYGWVILVVATIGMCASMPGQTIGVSVYTDRLCEALGLSAVQLSVAYMIGTLVSAAFLGRGGRFFDRTGARKAVVFSVVALGGVLIVLSYSDFLAKIFRLAAFPWVSGFVVITVGFAGLRFTGQGMVMLSSRAMLGKWFDRRRGLVTALSGVFVTFGFSAAPRIFEGVIQMVGWRESWRLMGLVCLFALPLFLWLLVRDNPEECGLKMDGGAREKAGKSNPDAVLHREYTLTEARRTLAFWAFNALFALNGLVATAYAFHVVTIAEELAVSKEYILELFIPQGVVSIVATLVIGFVADHTRLKYLLVLMALSAGAGFGAVAFGGYPTVAPVHFIGMGVASGCFGSLSAIVWPRFYGRKHLGVISGMFMTVIVVASAIGPFLFSLSDEWLGGYRTAFAVATVVAFGLAVLAAFADNPQRKNLES